jgi:hypothetical protein
LINKYLLENVNNNLEGFSTLGPNVNIGNNMDFEPKAYNNDEEYKLGLVPDFEPSKKYLDQELNFYGYATNNPESDNYYMNRGFINPNNAIKYVDDIQNNLNSFNNKC